MNLREAKKAVRDYMKLLKKEQGMWDRRVNMHKRNLLRLCEMYIKAKEKAGK